MDFHNRTTDEENRNYPREETEDEYYYGYDGRYDNTDRRQPYEDRSYIIEEVTTSSHFERRRTRYEERPYHYQQQQYHQYPQHHQPTTSTSRPISPIKYPARNEASQWSPNREYYEPRSPTRYRQASPYSNNQRNTSQDRTDYRTNQRNTSQDMTDYTTAPQITYQHDGEEEKE